MLIINMLNWYVWAIIAIYFLVYCGVSALTIKNAREPAKPVKVGLVGLIFGFPIGFIYLGIAAVGGGVTEGMLVGEGIFSGIVLGLITIGIYLFYFYGINANKGSLIRIIFAMAGGIVGGILLTILELLVILIMVILDKENGLDTFLSNFSSTLPFLKAVVIIGGLGGLIIGCILNCFKLVRKK